ncbi:MAG: hypothetical protein NUW21_02440, partial [Elusimicrobia bacterium]|nr:hypothetical protein [Elusimicrobiota bacterium]
MKKETRLSPVFLALSLFLASGPLPAAAQMRVQVGAGSGSGVPVVPALGGIRSGAGSLSNSPAALGLNGSFAAPSMTPSPLASAIPSAALQAPSALTVVIQAAATPDGAKSITIPTPGAAATSLAAEAAEYAAIPAAQAPAAKAAAAAPKSLGSRILDALL